MSLCRPQNSRGKTRRGNSSSRFQKYYCDLCPANCTSAAQLAQHFLGTKHKLKLQSIEPQEQTDGRRLCNFLKAHLKEDPIVGLEYVLEVKMKKSYKYSCQLCKVVNADLPTIVTHINDLLHIECYIRENFTYLLPRSRDKDRKGVYAKVLRDAAAMIVKWQGNNKEIQVVLPESDCKTRETSEDTPQSKPKSDGKTRGASEDTPPSKPKSDGKTRGASEDTPPSKHKSGNSSHSKLSPLPYQKMGLDESRESYRYNQMLQKYTSNNPPLAKRSRRSPGGERDTLPSTPHIPKHRSSHYERHAIRMDCTATQELEFRTNYEFLEYLANFVISDDEDVNFIRRITQNCIKALTSFQEEEAERQKTGHQPEAPLEDTSRTAQKIPGILEDETKLHLSDSKTTLLKDNSNPPSDSISKNEATNLFFNSIKDMDESEVVGVFQKIVATNPEFQEMDIHTVARFLKYSGRLKKP